MTRFGPLFLILTALAWLGVAAPAAAVLEVDITEGTVDPLPIAVPNFHPGEDSQEGDIDPAQIGADIARVVTADLERSGLFKPVNRKAFINATAPAISLQPSFADWRGIGTSALIMGQVDTQPDGRIMVQFRLWDVFAQQQMLGRRLRTTPGNWRQVAHMISDAIYERLTGEEGYFNTRIVYVAESGSRRNPTKRLAIMDQDGHNHEFLTDGDSLVLTPRFSPSRQEITYLSYQGDRPRVYLMNIDTGKQEVLGNFPGMTFAPRFAPDGNRVIMSMAENGNSDVYVMDLRTREMTRLTDHPAIDTSPSFAPDGSRVVFNSDRGGAQQLYVMNSDGSDVTRISFGGGRYATPVWSPRGDLIAFTKIRGGEFHIGVMEPDGSNERILTTSYLDEAPTWAPNGRVLMFFRQTRYTQDGGGGNTSLWSVDITGYNERRVITPVEASDPAWSPLIQ